MSLTDAIEILNFIQGHKSDNPDCLISCAYGKSRSVTTALYLSHLDNPDVPAPSEVPNPHVLNLLIKARSLRLRKAD
jgi:hypothetical protein